ncbi:BTB/POZ domain-containing protein 2-like isoform X2 [Pseudomyrmex gracilis]|uniref:BTB/POZ domain-containing protein 2-like isoform X2 n=1 Tax=Pseudomyrmex gracilis TaxID=219809 RepID=UPI000995A744|nr:BTB/POZ domain-containing protein 2-like isoform X2 [Pseudomyrmex gracilis]
MDPLCDWQTKVQNVIKRSEFLFGTGLWSDCQFIVGQESQQQIFKGHKVFLAMTSPVFEAMFFGSMAEKNDPIPITDVQPRAFRALLEYIYTNEVKLWSVGLACDLYYCAKKYMIPFLVKQSKDFLLLQLSSQNTCKIYEHAKLCEDHLLMKKCMHIIRSRTDEVLNESSWEDVELDTVLTVLEQNNLKLSSELNLFNAVERWAKSECRRKNLDPKNGSSLKSVIGNALSKIRFLDLNLLERICFPNTYDNKINNSNLCFDLMDTLMRCLCAIGLNIIVSDRTFDKRSV